MSDFRLIIMDDAGVVAAFETCSADIKQARDRARTWTEIGFQVELRAGPQTIGKLTAQSDRQAGMRGAEAAMLIGLLACTLLAARIVSCYEVNLPSPSDAASLFVEPAAE